MLSDLHKVGSVVSGRVGHGISAGKFLGWRWRRMLMLGSNNSRGKRSDRTADAFGENRRVVHRECRMNSG